RVLASAGPDDVRLWEVSTGRLRWRRQHRLFRGYAWSWSVLAFSPDGKLLAVGGADGSVRLWETDAGGERHVVHTAARTITNVAVSPDGQRLAAGGEGGPVHLIDPRAGQLLGRWGASASVETLAFSADGKSLVAVGGGQDGKGWARCRWDTATGE